MRLWLSNNPVLLLHILSESILLKILTPTSLVALVTQYSPKLQSDVGWNPWKKELSWMTCLMCLYTSLLTHAALKTVYTSIVIDGLDGSSYNQSHTVKNV